ncbi:MAG: hypothetical protein KA004_19350 [Verrucomicrobiales bacterium]|nr:hypothetical protein [Verrucomicrobiales bacterium]
MNAIFVAVSGISPAIIRETVWAQALETPATVPDESTGLRRKAADIRTRADNDEAADATVRAHCLTN